MGRKRNNKRKLHHGPKKVRSASSIIHKVKELLAMNENASFSVERIVKSLNVRDKNTKEVIKKYLDEELSKGRLSRLDNGNYVYEAGQKGHHLEGVVDFVSPKHAFIICEDSEEDVYVRAEDLRYALNGDIVEVALFSKSKGRRPEGSVVKIIERVKKDYVGRLEISRQYAFLVPDSRKMHYDIYVPIKETKKAKHNDKVIVTLTAWPGHDKKPEGVVKDVLGASGDNDAEMHAILAEFELPLSFGDRVKKEASKIESDISKEEISKRRDMRGINTFTIDPEDAKDFDDALSFQKLENGNYEIGVHIADVSHYVREGSVIDKEAFGRATSVYLVDRTIPMLPERLSNELCSLRPKEDKLTFSAIFEIDNEAKVVDEWYGRTVIHSDRRFTYEEAQEVIESQKGEFCEEITVLNTLSKKLRERRFKKGAVNFETTEVKFMLDEKGKPLGVVPKVRKDAHKLIEEFMLLANRSVATYIYSKRVKGERGGYTFVYRTHDAPNPEKLEDFSLFAGKFGHELDFGAGNISRTLNKLMGEIEGKPEQDVLENLAIRSMAKAKYTTEPDGHFGLAFSHYSHFTSPIRRYPDVMVHRLLQHYLSGGKPAQREEYEEACDHSSQMEKRAADAERASIKYKQVEFMQNVVGKEFAGLVSGVTDWGIFVEIVETKCEGMVRMSSLTDDYYDLDEKNYRVIGRKNKKIIALGDQIEVLVVGTDLDRRTIDLEFVTK